MRIANFIKKSFAGLVALSFLASSPAISSVTVTVNGSSYTIPQTNEKGWGTNVTTWIQGISLNTLQPTGGSFTLSADVDFGASFGLKAPYFTSKTSTPGTAGVFRLAKTDLIDWRNNANSGNLALGIDGSDNLTFNGTAFLPSAGLTASRAVVTNGSSLLASATTTATEIGYVNGVTSSLCGINQACTLTNKTLTTPVIAQISNTGTLTLPTSSDTLVGRATTDTLTNKTLSGNVATNLVSGAATNTFPTTTGQLVGITANQYGVIASGTGTGLASVIAPNASTAFPLVSGGVAANPSWAALTVAGGGTGLTSGTSGGVPYFSSSSAMTSSAALAQYGVVLGGGAGAAPATLAPNASTAFPLISGGASANPAWAKLSEAGGGTNQTSYAAGDTLYASASNTLSKLTVGSANQVLKVSNGLPVWATPSAGGVNYINANADAEVDTSGWTTYADAAQNIPVDATGGAPSSTWTRTTSTPLAGSGSFLWTRTAANRQGEGVAFPFTINNSDQGRVLAVNFNYKIVSGTFFASDGVTAPSNDGGVTQNAGNSDLEVFVYDVTNSVLIPVSPQVLTCTSAVSCSFKATFQTPSNSTSYRFVLHTARSTAVAFTAQFDDFFVGPQSVAYGSAITDWTSWTPTGSWSTNTTFTGQKRKVGDSNEYIFKISLAGAPTSASLTVNLPAGDVMDTTKLNDSSAITNMGNCAIYDDSASILYSGRVRYSSTTAVNIGVLQDDATYGKEAQVTQALPVTFANLDIITCWFKAPIVGSSSTVLMSNDADTRVTQFTGNLNYSTALTGTPAKIPFTSVTDTHGGYSTDTYTIQVSGRYRISAAVALTGSVTGAGRINVYKNGAIANIGGVATVTNGFTLQVFGVGELVLVAGDTIDVRADAISGTLAGGGVAVGMTTLAISRISGPSAIAASETVSASYTESAGSAITISTPTIFKYLTKVFDDQSGYSTSTGLYTVKIPGKYRVSAFVTTTPVSIAVGGYVRTQVYKTGVASLTNFTSGSGASNTFTGSVTGTISCLAGDTIGIYVDSSVSTTAITTASNNVLSIERVGN